ncbi:hypothetical protein EDB86DRAFT_2979097 [Lactarius hatsudake]|nr:hypothetical protein EDB86DRAFT_2979097 [Lactarius hatsudake]
MHKTLTFSQLHGSGFGVFSLGPTSHGWVAISVISSRHSSLLTIDLDNSPSLSPCSSPSPLLALASCHHRPPSTPTPLQDAPQPPIDRPHIPAPRVIFVPQHPAASLISHFPFKHIKFTLGCLWPPARRCRSPCAAVGFGRGVVLSYVIMSWPPFHCYSHSLATFHS